MKRFLSILGALLLFCLLTACGAEESSSSALSADSTVSAIPADILEWLSAYPSDYHEICDCEDLVVIAPRNTIINQDLWDSFLTDVKNGVPTEVITAQLTTEGDSILTYTSYDGTAFFLVSDSSRDQFGADPRYQSNTFSYLQPIMSGNLELYVLANKQLEDFDAYQVYCQSDPSPMPKIIYKTSLFSQEMTLNDICGDGSVSPEAIKAALETAMGMPWDTYSGKLFDAFETDDYSAVTLSLEGTPSYYVISENQETGKVRSICFTLYDSSLDAEAWLRYTEQITQKLSDHCIEKKSFSWYQFTGGQIMLDFGPVDPEAYTVHDDGTASYAGIPNELGNRILTIRITFKDTLQ